MTEGEIHINYTKAHKQDINRTFCPDCKKDLYFALFFQEWYGWDSTCMRCGRIYSCGEWHRLPFYRYARRDNKDSARRAWKRGVSK